MHFFFSWMSSRRFLSISVIRSFTILDFRGNSAWFSIMAFTLSWLVWYILTWSTPVYALVTGNFFETLGCCYELSSPSLGYYFLARFLGFFDKGASILFWPSSYEITSSRVAYLVFFFCCLPPPLFTGFATYCKFDTAAYCVASFDSSFLDTRLILNIFLNSC